MIATWHPWMWKAIMIQLMPRVSFESIVSGYKRIDISFRKLFENSRNDCKTSAKHHRIRVLNKTDGCWPICTHSQRIRSNFTKPSSVHHPGIQRKHTLSGSLSIRLYNNSRCGLETPCNPFRDQINTAEMHHHSNRAGVLSMEVRV